MTKNKKINNEKALLFAWGGAALTLLYIFLIPALEVRQAIDNYLETTGINVDGLIYFASFLLLIAIASISAYGIYKYYSNKSSREKGAGQALSLILGAVVAFYYAGWLFG